MSDDPHYRRIVAVFCGVTFGMMGFGGLVHLKELFDRLRKRDGESRGCKER